MEIASLDWNTVNVTSISKRNQGDEPSNAVMFGVNNHYIKGTSLFFYLLRKMPGLRKMFSQFQCYYGTWLHHGSCTSTLELCALGFGINAFTGVID